MEHPDVTDLKRAGMPPVNGSSYRGWIQLVW